jgi:hypothetical protein
MKNDSFHFQPSIGFLFSSLMIETGKLSPLPLPLSQCLLYVVFALLSSFSSQGRRNVLQSHRCADQGLHCAVIRLAGDGKIFLQFSDLKPAQQPAPYLYSI